MPYGPEMCVESKSGTIHLGGATPDELKAGTLTLPPEGTIEWVVRAPQGDVFLGGAHISDAETDPRLWGFINKDIRRRGVGTAMIRAVIHAAFHPSHLRLNYLSASIDRANYAALRMAAANGFIWTPSETLLETERRLVALNPDNEPWHRHVEDLLDLKASSRQASDIRDTARHLMSQLNVHFCAEVGCAQAQPPASS